MTNYIRVSIITIALALPGCVSAPQTVLERLSEARQLTAELLVQVTKATDAANRAVMAGNEQAAADSRHEADRAQETARADAAKLKSLLEDLRYEKELEQLQQFEDRFTKYRELDRTIAGMVADSTNVKAQRLSFGAAREEADAVRDALEPVRQKGQASDSFRKEALVATVMLSIREIQSLQMPHILEADDGVMTQLEKRMGTAETDARRALGELAALLSPASQAQLTGAERHIDRFLSINAEILKLSRTNSNVHALALSLGQQRTLVAASEESLRALQDALAKRGFTGTR
jgi:GTP cyclohydrolase III